MSISDWTVSPALALDLDGTVRHNRHDPEGFINSADDVALYPDVEAKLWQYRDAGYLILGISNQGGVAFGHKTPAGCDAEIDATVDAFERNPFHLIKCCYHHPKGTVEPYSHRSLLRKPDIGILAVMEMEMFRIGYVIDWDRSLMVGDRGEDVRCSQNAGIEFLCAYEFFGRPE